MEHKQQVYNERRLSGLSVGPAIVSVSGSLRSRTCLRPVTFALMLSVASGFAAPAYADDSSADSGLSTAAQVWGYAQGITRSITEGVAGWFGRGDSPAVSVNDESSRPEPDTASANRSGDLMLEAFPALQQSAGDSTLRLLDGNQEVGGTGLAFGPARQSGTQDLAASYVWESPRFGQFILSTNTGYQTRDAGRLMDSRTVQAGASESAASRSGNPALNNLGGAVPELQSSFTFTWQIGNHTATAVTTYADSLDNFNSGITGQINIEQLNELVGQIGALDLRYGYSIRTGRQSSASFSVGVRNLFDRRALLPNSTGVSNRLTEPSRVAYGSIKYQF